MSPKQEPTSKHSYLYLALSVVEQSCRETLSTWDISNLSAKVATLHNMAQVIEAAIARLEGNSDEQ